MANTNTPTIEGKTFLVEPQFDIEYTRTDEPGMIGFDDTFEISIVKVKLNGHDVMQMLTVEQLNELQTNIEEQESKNPTKQKELYTHE